MIERWLIVSQEGENFQVEKRVAKMSKLVKTMLPPRRRMKEGGGEANQQEIFLPNVKGVILGKVMEFCKHYCEEPMNEIEKPLKSSSMHEVVQ